MILMSLHFLKTVLAGHDPKFAGLMQQNSIYSPAREKSITNAHFEP